MQMTTNLAFAMPLVFKVNSLNFGSKPSGNIEEPNDIKE